MALPTTNPLVEMIQVGLFAGPLEPGSTQTVPEVPAWIVEAPQELELELEEVLELDEDDEVDELEVDELELEENELDENELDEMLELTEDEAMLLPPDETVEDEDDDDDEEDDEELPATTLKVPLNWVPLSEALTKTLAPGKGVAPDATVTVTVAVVSVLTTVPLTLHPPTF